MQSRHTDVPLESLRTSRRPKRNKSNTIDQNNKLSTKEYPGIAWDKIKSLLREYNILSNRIISEHSSALPHFILLEEQFLRRYTFNLLQKKGVKI